MEYSIRSLAEVAGVRARTLGYYDEIKLLKPLYVNEAGYGYYGDKELAIIKSYWKRQYGIGSTGCKIGID